ncbi:MAG: glycosyltransferase [Paludibacteraceae bacterium]|jgi:glycosyltransferase involved in cell wall biosynthesis|nr:glycosyltransferase [Paludibacteraceae bacterium]MBP9016848.1 glycosyltransferase [Paludibacteraceae bacterium]
MNKPLVSIITPTYNHEKYISDCILSVISQTYENWEMIIVDDGSTDKTYEIARSFAENDQRIKVFTQQNVGIFRLAETYNFALSVAQGKYIAILEGDDVWVSEKLSLQVEALEKNENAVFCYGQAYSVSQDLSEIHSTNEITYPIEKLNNRPIGSITGLLMFSNFIPALTVMIRKETLLKLGGFIQTHHLPLVDWTTWIYLSLQGEFVFIPQLLGKWRMYPYQITKTYTAELYENIYRFLVAFYHEHPDTFAGTEVSEAKLRDNFFRLLVVAYSRSGRYKLIRKDFKNARKDYVSSIFRFGFRKLDWKLRSLVGLIFSFFHADIEKLAKMLGRISYK